MLNGKTFRIIYKSKFKTKVLRAIYMIKIVKMQRPDETSPEGGENRKD